mgnify:CR=1 FL=1
MLEDLAEKSKSQVFDEQLPGFWWRRKICFSEWFNRKPPTRKVINQDQRANHKTALKETIKQLREEVQQLRGEHQREIAISCTSKQKKPQSYAGS